MEKSTLKQPKKINNMSYPINPIYMKPNFYIRLFGAFVIGGILAACSAATPEEDKPARLEKLKKEQAELGKQIKKLEEQIAKENPNAEDKIKAKEVGIVDIAPKKFDHYVQTQGRVESENNIMISSKAMGVVTSLSVTEGQLVSKGQVLAQIDNSIIERSIESMEAQLELAKTVYERQENLWKQKIGTEVQYLQAKANKETLEKQLASLREQNETYKIKAPISGTVDATFVKEGESTAPGQPAFRVVNSNELKLVASVSEAYVTDIKKGNKVIVTIPELKQDIEARVTFAGRTIDPLSRTFNVEVALPSQAELRPNMTATVKVVFRTESSALVVPVNVIQEINNEKVVYVVESKGKNTVAKRKVITVEGVYGGYAQINGLKAGEKLIIIGYQGINDGDFVKI